MLSDDAGTLRTERCGLILDGDSAQLDLKPACTVLAPEADSAVSPDTRLSWSMNDGVIFDVEFDPDEPSAATPTVHVFTGANQGTFPDLATLGVPALVGEAYDLRIGALGPFNSLDDAVTPGGLAASIRAEAWTSYSVPVAILVSD